MTQQEYQDYLDGLGIDPAATPYQAPMNDLEMPNHASVMPDQDQAALDRYYSTSSRLTNDPNTQYNAAGPVTPEYSNAGGDPWYKQVANIAATGVGVVNPALGKIAQYGAGKIPGGGVTNGGLDANQTLVGTGPFASGGEYNPNGDLSLNPARTTINADTGGSPGGGYYDPTSDLSLGSGGAGGAGGLLPEGNDLGPDPQFQIDAGNYPGSPAQPAVESGGSIPSGTGSSTGSSPAGGTMPYNSASYPYTTAEPLQMFEQNRIAAGDYANQAQNDLTAAANRSATDYATYKDQAASGPGGYGTILAGGGGYSTAETDAMLQKQLIDSGLATPEQLARYDYTGAEKTGIAGNPMAGYDAFQAGMPGVTGAVGTMNDMYGQAIDPAKLGLSADYLQNYNVTPQDMQNIRDSAGRTVGLNTQSEIDRISRAASAQGQTSPLALASALSRRSYTGDINAGTAMTDADIKARQLGLTVASNRETARLGTVQDISNRQMTQASTVGTAGVDAAKFGTTGAASYAQAGDTATSQRATDLATAERAALTTQLGTNYQQSLGAGTYYGGVAAKSADLNQSLAQQGRTYLTTQEQAAKDAEQKALDQKNAAAATGLSGTNAGAVGATQAKYLPSAWEKGTAIAFGAGGAIANAAGF